MGNSVYIYLSILRKSLPQIICFKISHTFSDIFVRFKGKYAKCVIYVCVFICSIYPETGPLASVANGIVVRTTTWVIFTADCSLKRTTSPWKAKFSNSKYTTTSSAWSATVISTTNVWWVHRWRRRWSWIWGILALLYGIGRLHYDSTFACHACC